MWNMTQHTSQCACRGPGPWLPFPPAPRWTATWKLFTSVTFPLSSLNYSKQGILYMQICIYTHLFLPAKQEEPHSWVTVVAWVNTFSCFESICWARNFWIWPWKWILQELFGKNELSQEVLNHTLSWKEGEGWGITNTWASLEEPCLLREKPVVHGHKWPPQRSFCLCEVLVVVKHFLPISPASLRSVPPTPSQVRSCDLCAWAVVNCRGEDRWSCSFLCWAPAPSLMRAVTLRKLFNLLVPH